MLRVLLDPSVSIIYFRKKNVKFDTKKIRKNKSTSFFFISLSFMDPPFTQIFLFCSNISFVIKFKRFFNALTAFLGNCLVFKLLVSSVLKLSKINSKK